MNVVNSLILVYFDSILSLIRASLVFQMVKNLPAMQETQVQSLGWENLLEKGMTSHFSILAWRIPCHKEWDTTEQLTLHFFASIKNSSKYPL